MANPLQAAGHVKKGDSQSRIRHRRDQKSLSDLVREKLTTLVVVAGVSLILQYGEMLFRLSLFRKGQSVLGKAVCDTQSRC